MKGTHSQQSSEIWQTKYGSRRVRRELPTLDEAIFAARGLTDNEQAQAEIAASLMGLSLEEVRAAMLKSKPARRDRATLSFAGRHGAERAVVVERKPTRRIAVRSYA